MTVSYHGPKLIGVARDLVLNYLKANLNAEVLNNADYFRGDGINIEPFNTEAFYISEAFLSIQPPACYVLRDGPMRIDNTDDPNYVQATDPFIIIVSCEDTGSDVLLQKCETYGQIVFKLLDQLDLLSTDGLVRLHLTVNEIDVSDQLAKKLGETGEIYRQDSIIRVSAKHFEARLTATP